MWQGWVYLVAGIWIAVSSVVTALMEPTSFVISGAVAAIAGFWSYPRWQGVVVGILSLWVILSAFVPTLQRSANFGFVGTVIALLALWQNSAVERQTPMTSQ